MISPKPLSPLLRFDSRRSQQRPKSKPTRGPVTVALGFVYDEGLVFCADTKVVYPVKGNESKLPFFTFDNGRCAVQFAISSDDVNFPKSAITRCVEMIDKVDFSTATIDSIKNAAEFSLGEFYREHIYTHPDRAPTQLYMQMLIGIWVRNETRLYALHETVLVRVEKYECLGAGEYLSKYLIKQYERANPGPFALADAALLAEFCVEEAIDYDDKCGGEPEFIVMRNSGDISNACEIALYPCFGLPRKLQGETWTLLRDLAHAKMKGTAALEADGLVDKHCERVRESELSSRICWGSRTLAKDAPE